MDTSKATKAISHSVSLAVVDWMTWIGFAVLDYAGDVLKTQVDADDNVWKKALLNGASDSLKFSFYQAYKFPALVDNDLLPTPKKVSFSFAA